MKKIFILFLLLALSMAQRSDAQLATGYTCVSLSGQTYTSISGGTTINSNSGLDVGDDDDGSKAISLPFTFTYDGIGYSTVTFCTNGWIGMNNLTSSVSLSQGRTPGNLFSTTVPNTTIAPWFGDGSANWTSGGGSMVHGTVGTDVYAFEWRNATGTSFNNSSTVRINFMLKIYGPASSNPGRIEFLYGTASSGITTGRSIGIEDATGGSGHYINALTNSSSSTSTAGSWPGNGNGYRFEPPCNSTPIPGNTISSTGFICASTNFTLSIQNSLIPTGITYQWQSSSDNITWNNVSSATNATLTTQQSATTYYRCKVTCSNTGGFAYSTAIKVNQVTTCYPTPGSSNCGFDDKVVNVTIGTLNNSSSCSSNGYTNYSGSVAAPILLNPSYSLSVTGGPGGNETIAAWIDYDHSGTFDTSEYTLIGTYNIGSGPVPPVSNTINIPGTATAGYTMMRVRDRWDGSLSPSLLKTDGNTSYGYGETEDYMVHVGCPAIEFTGIPVDTRVCPASNTTFTASAFGVGVGYQWQVSTDSGATWTNITNAAPYSGATTNALTITGVALSQDGYRYRVVASTTCSVTTATSVAAILNVNNTPVVNTNPVSGPVCVGSNTSFTANITGGVVAYLWQISTDGGTTWTALANNTRYSGVTTNTLTITNAIASLNNNQYRALGNNGCFTSNTTAATLTVNPLPAITGNPTGGTLCPGDNFSFTAAASGVGISYQWQVSTDGGTTWNNLTNVAPYSNVTSATMNITSAPASINGYKYRAVATSSACAPPVTTTAATLVVNTIINFTQQPVNVTACEGSAAVFTLSALSTGLTYQWQESTNGTTWTNLTNVAPYSGTTTNTLSVTASIGMYNYQYRCIVSSSCALPTASSIATLFVKTLPTITAQPVNTTVCDGTVTTSAGVFTVGTTGSNLTYQWQVSTNSGGTWSNATGSPYLNPTTNTLTVSNPLPSFSGYQYRVVVSGYCTPSVTSTAATLTVNTRPIITTQPTNSFICQGDNGTFTVVAAATGIVYQWQSYNASTSSWSNLTNSSAYSNVNTATLTVTAPAFSTNGANAYRCVISGTCTPPVTTNAVYHFISTPPTITYQPIDAAGCIGGTATFTTTASATTPSNTSNYQWQVDNGTGFVNISNGAPYSGATSSILKITGVTLSMNGYQYRCIVSTSCGAPVISAKAKLVTQGLPAIATQPSNVTVCPGTLTTITVGATGSTLAYQWQVNTGSGFVNIATSNPLYVGAKTANLTIPSPISSMNNYTYRCVVSGYCTPSVTSNSMTLKVYNPVVIASQTIADTVCETSQKKIGLKASGNALSYQWQMLSTTPGLYTDLLNVPPYSGTNTDSLRFTNTPASISGNVYRCRVTENILCNLNFYTNDIPITVNPAPVSTPPSITAQNLGTASFSVPNVGTKFQWQENAQNTGFFDITDPTHFDGINTSTLAIKDIVVGMSGNQYRCVVDGVCVTPVASKPSTLSVDNGLGVKQMAWSDVSMSVYPNPLSGTQLNISFSKSMKGKTDIRVLDKLGKLVYEGTITPGQNNIASVELQALAAGVYLLQVNNEEGKFSQTVRFTKQ